MAVKAWERRPDETTKAYAGFAAYRDLGVKRSIESAWKQYANTDKKMSGYFGLWAAEFDWVARAAAYDDYIDAEARKRLDREAIRRKADMLRRHAEVGKVLQTRGLQFLQQHGIDRGSDAITAIIKGIDTERKSEGLPEYLLQVMDATDDELARQYNELLATIGGTGSGNEEAGDGDPATASPEDSDQ